MKKFNTHFPNERIQEFVILAIIFALIIAVTIFTWNK